MTQLDHAMIDRAWWGYHPRAGFPAVALAATLSATLLIGRWALEDLFWFAEQAGALVVYAVTLAVWPGLLTTLIYRSITYTYRLTDRAILIDWGFRNTPEPPVPYSAIQSVTIETGVIGRLFQVGAVVITVADGRTVKLIGLYKPAQFVSALQSAMTVFKTSTHDDSDTPTTAAPH